MSASGLAPPPPEVDRDGRLMDAALMFGRRWLGATGSNPAVGAILVRDGAIVAHGATQPGGRPHAETEALHQAGERARGATLYVTLEPCSHDGQTPPCAGAVVAAGVARVVSALEDPDPRVAGRGHRLLTQAGIDVSVGLRAARARRAHLGHILRVTQGRPMVTLKLAETADGFAAGGAGEARLLITGEAAHLKTQIMRSMHDGIMVGVRTAMADDPFLTVRLPGLEARKPLRVILDPRARLPLASNLVSSAGEWPTLVLTRRDAPSHARRALERRGVETDAVDASPNGIDLTSALAMLARRGLARIFAEGGPKIASALLEHGLADDVALFRGPAPLGRPGLPSLSSQARQILESEGGAYLLADQGHSGHDKWLLFERTF